MSRAGGAAGAVRHLPGRLSSGPPAHLRSGTHACHPFREDPREGMRSVRRSDRHSQQGAAPVGGHAQPRGAPAAEGALSPDPRQAAAARAPHPGSSGLPQHSRRLRHGTCPMHGNISNPSPPGTVSFLRAEPVFHNSSEPQHRANTPTHTDDEEETAEGTHEFYGWKNLDGKKETGTEELFKPQ